jgi:hypothetical protein
MELLSPIGFRLDPDSLRDPVDVVEVRDHLDRVMDRGIAPPLGPQPLDPRIADRSRLMSQLHGEVAERAHARLEVGPPIIVRCVLRELVWCALGTEVVCVRANSVVAVVGAGDDDREELPLGS